MAELTNEELATRIHNGEEELLPQLWHQVEAFAQLKAYKMARKFDSPVFDKEDLFQSAYFALVDAVKYWAPDTECKFLTFFNTCLKTSFAEAGGWRTQTQKAQWEHDNIPLSLDAPFVDDEGNEKCLYDITVDNRDDYEALENEIYNKQLRTELDTLIQQLPQNQGEIIDGVYFKGIPAKAFVEKQGISYSRVQSLRHQALTTMRRKTRTMPRSSVLREYVDRHTNWNLHIGLNAFNSTGTREVETIVIRREEIERKALRKLGYA